MRSFVEKELSPYSDDIDRQNDFPQMRVREVFTHSSGGLFLYLYSTILKRKLCEVYTVEPR